MIGPNVVTRTRSPVKDGASLMVETPATHIGKGVDRPSFLGGSEPWDIPGLMEADKYPNTLDSQIVPGGCYRVDHHLDHAQVNTKVYPDILGRHPRPGGVCSLSVAVRWRAIRPDQQRFGGKSSGESSQDRVTHPLLILVPDGVLNAFPGTPLTLHPPC